MRGLQYAAKRGRRSPPAGLRRVTRAATRPTGRSRPARHEARAPCTARA